MIGQLGDPGDLPAIIHGAKYLPAPRVLFILRYAGEIAVIVLNTSRARATY